MPEFTYPGPTLRPLPAFAVDAPEGWRPSEAAGVLAAFLDAEEHDGFTANVVVGIDRAAAGVPLAEFAAATFAQNGPEVGLEDERLVELRDGTAVLRRQRRPTPHLEDDLVQLIALLLVPGPAPDTLSDLVTITGTCLAARADADIPVLHDVIASFRITG